jgi:hypothetical protein
VHPLDALLAQERDDDTDRYDGDFAEKLTPGVNGFGFVDIQR